MALIKCKDCANEVSTDAKNCPKCGAKIKKPTSKATWMIGAIVMGGIFISLANKPPSSSTEAAVKTPEQQAASKKRDAQLQIAAMAAINLKKSMKDPDSFKLTSAVVKDSGATCYNYHATNSFGATIPGSAILTSKGQLLVEEHEANGFATQWNKECTHSGGDDIAAYIKQTGII